MTSTDIALKSIEQIQSMNVLELKNCCKILGLKGWSKLTKPLLIDLVFKASDVERIALQKANKDRLTASQKKDKIARIKRKEEGMREHPISVATINNLYKKKLSSDIIANTLFKLCSDNYADITIAKNCSKKLNDTLPNTVLSETEQSILKDNWKKLVYAINYARREKETQLLKTYARKATKTINSKAIVEWAINNINSDNDYIKGLALSLTSGRRMIEIYGNTKYSLGKIGIFAAGLAKKADDQDDTCEFIPLCDRQIWLDSFNSLSLKNLDRKKLNSISALISRHFPKILKDMGVEKFKDCRDVYAAICYKNFNEFTHTPIVFTRDVMGHDSIESTIYYTKFSCQPIESLQDIFIKYTELK